MHSCFRAFLPHRVQVLEIEQGTGENVLSHVLVGSGNVNITVHRSAMVKDHLAPDGNVAKCSEPGYGFLPLYSQWN